MPLLSAVLFIASNPLAFALPFGLVVLFLFVLVLDNRANRNAVRLLRAWKRPGGK